MLLGTGAYLYLGTVRAAPDAGMLLGSRPQRSGTLANATKQPGILRNRNYVVMLSGQLVSQIGNSFFPLAIYWFTFSLTKSRLDLGYLSAVIGVTSILGMLTGVLVDRWDRRRTMIWSDATRAVLAGALAVLAFSGRLGLP
ncbi:major facilitator superfamily MFS_1, partial [mine drainage metagenome]